MSTILLSRELQNQKNRLQRQRTKSRKVKHIMPKFTPIKSATQQILKENQNRQNREKKLTASRHKEILQKGSSKVAKYEFLSPSRLRGENAQRMRFNSQNYFKGTVCSPSANSYTGIFYSKRNKKIIKNYSPNPRSRENKRGFLSRSRLMSPNNCSKFPVNDENMSINSIYRERLKVIHNRASRKAKNSIQNECNFLEKRNNKYLIDQKLQEYYGEIDDILRKRGLEIIGKIFMGKQKEYLNTIQSFFTRKKFKISISKKNETKISSERESSVSSIKRKLFPNSTRTRKGYLSFKEDNPLLMEFNIDKKDCNFMRRKMKNINHFATFTTGDDSFLKNEAYTQRSNQSKK